MKLKFLLIVSLITISSYSQNAIPTYTEVVTKLFNEYAVDSINQINYVQIEKRAIGWKVLIIDPKLKDTISELLWDNQKRQYNKVSIPKKGNYEEDEYAIEGYIKSKSSQRFNSLEYYGYVGWDEDLINLYENKGVLTDVELYSLGYAYSNYATGLLNDNFDFSNEKIKFHLPVSENSMNNIQLETYLQVEEKAINAYLELYKRTPKFETIPGEIGIKYYNEIASNFLNLRIYQNEETAALQLIDKDLYSDNYKMYAKNMLDSCEKDAILFTNGDNDTFPLLIYQTQNNYRKDVLIVNTSLIQVPHYINRMMHRVLDSDGIKLSISLDIIKDNISEILIFEIKKEDFLSIENLNSIILDESNLYEGYAKSYRTIPSNNFTFHQNNSVLKWNIDQQALYRSHLIMLDIIATNKWKRPIYFASNGSNDIYLGLSKYLQFEGLVYKLTSNEGVVLEDEIGFINAPKLEKNITNMFQFENKTNLPIEERQLIMDFRLIYNRLANYYIEEEEVIKAELILDKISKVYPNDLAYFSFDTLSIIESYFKMKLFKKGKILEKQLLQNLKDGLDNYSFISVDQKNAKYEQAKNYLLSINKYYNVN